MLDLLYKVLSGVVLGIFLSTLFKGCGGQEKGIPVGKPTIVHTTDTLYLPSHVTYQKVFIPTQVIKYLPGKTAHDTIYTSKEVGKLQGLLTSKLYQDTTHFGKYRKVISKVYVHGVADSLRVRLVDDTPITHIIDSTTITQAVVRDRWRLGIGGTVSPTALSPGILVEKDRHSFQIGYSVLPLGQVTVGYHFLLRR